MKIREDLVGVVLAHADGGTVMLRAGDAVPDGATVGQHVLAREAPVHERPKGNSSRELWAAWAEHIGLPVDEKDTRDDIMSAVEAAEA
ncbi:MAG: hypothetical protein FWH11_01260 [Micrococcales bacterium]|nr:hypothetical protein [Micrococcales bacterium]